VNQDFPSNSHRPVKPSEPAADPTDGVPKFEKVVSGNATQRKKPLGRRLLNTFFGGDSGVFSYLLKDVLVPALQDVATDMVKKGIDKAVYGEVRNHGRTIRGSSLPRTHISYDRTTSLRPSHAPINRPSPQRSAQSIDDIVLDSMLDVQTTTDQLYGALRKYGLVRVASLYEMIGQTPAYTDYKFGWYDLDDMEVKRIGSGQFLLIMPDPVDIR